MIHTKTTKHEVTGQIDYKDLVALICKQIPVDKHTAVRVEIFVQVPGGGDHSYEQLDCQQAPVQFRATWVEQIK